MPANIYPVTPEGEAALETISKEFKQPVRYILGAAAALAIIAVGIEGADWLISGLDTVLSRATELIGNNSEG